MKTLAMLLTGVLPTIHEYISMVYTNVGNVKRLRRVASPAGQSPPYARVIAPISPITSNVPTGRMVKPKPSGRLSGLRLYAAA